MGGPYNLIDLESMLDDEINYEKHVSILLYVLKHIHDRNLLKVVSQMLERGRKAVIIDRQEKFIHIRQVMLYIDSRLPAEEKQRLEEIVAENLSKEETGKIMRTIADTYIEEGMNKGIALGKTEGIALGKSAGISEGMKKVACRMLRANTDIDFISSVTGLSIAEISKL